MIEPTIASSSPGRNFFSLYAHSSSRAHPIVPPLDYYSYEWPLLPFSAAPLFHPRSANYEIFENKRIEFKPNQKTSNSQTQSTATNPKTAASTPPAAAGITTAPAALLSSVAEAAAELAEDDPEDESEFVDDEEAELVAAASEPLLVAEEAEPEAWEARVEVPEADEDELVP